MNLVKCINGHFYDGSRFAECPHCMQIEVQETVSADMSGGQAGTGQAGKEADRKDSVIAAGDSGSMIEPVYRESPPDDVVTVGMYKKIIGVEPVVGWLVCVRGEYFGESFKLRAGKNFIGRASDMDVILGMDKSISRNRHACIIYEPKSRIFIAQPGESKELFYLNDKVVLGNVEMRVNDVLQIGESSLMLIPCCNEKFSWDDLD